MDGQDLFFVMLFPVSGCRQEFRLYDLQIAICKSALDGNLLCKNKMKHLLLKTLIKVVIYVRKWDR